MLLTGGLCSQHCGVVSFNTYSVQGGNDAKKKCSNYGADHLCDLSKFHYAYIHRQACVDGHPQSIQSKEPSFCDESLTREPPASILF